MASAWIDSSGDESDLFDNTLQPQALPGFASESLSHDAESAVRVSAAAAHDASVVAQPAGETDDLVDVEAPASISPRGYQLEMLDLSLQEDVIVVMDTGSGKTQVAVLRIKAELERASSEKIVWFLAPTVSLCQQQHRAIKLQVPFAQVQLLTSHENVHTWNASAWAAALDRVRIVVSTYQVLLDGLSNAFTSMDNIALIIFDEAHNCTGKHPGRKLMEIFYHMRSDRGGPLPSVLGLTATPSTRSQTEEIAELEWLLSARCVTPNIHREALLRFVSRPEIRLGHYQPPGTLDHLTPAMEKLQRAWQDLDIGQDPYVLSLKAEPTERNLERLAKAIAKFDTYSQHQIKGLWTRCKGINRQLGSWAADTYLWKVSRAFLSKADRGDGFFDQWSNDEKQYVATFLRRLSMEAPPLRPVDYSDLSHKVLVLLQTLDSIDDPVVGIVFARERSVVAMLCEILRSCPNIVAKYRVGAMVGGSKHSDRARSLYEFWSDSDQSGLENFRTGKLNLLVGTSVLEEGIDIPACNLIVCFDRPDTPKAFIQRRGRARMKGSILVWMTEDSSFVLDQWEELERKLKEAYEDEEREARQLAMLEKTELTSDTFFEVESTGAVLDLDNAKQRLQHFCSTLCKGEFVESHPEYILKRHSDGSTPYLSAIVLLPPFVPESLRRICGCRTWLSEKNATKDAAFQAYLALYKAGLINENLLPFRFDNSSGIESRTAETIVQPPYNPWYRITEAWESSEPVWVYPVTYEDEHCGRTEYEILLPTRLDQLGQMETFLNIGRTSRCRFHTPRSMTFEQALESPDHTSTLLALPFGHRWKGEDHPQVIKIASETNMSVVGIGQTPLDLENERHVGGLYLVRDLHGTPYFYGGFIADKPPIHMVHHPSSKFELAPSNEPYLVLAKWSKNKLAPNISFADSCPDLAVSEGYPWVLPLSFALVDSIPAKHARFGTLIPAILHHFSAMLSVKQLATTILQPIGITDLELIRTAMTSRSACEPVHYERLEFLGDSILKYCSSVQAATEHPEWPEGYLSAFRDSLVSNSRLCRAAIESGLSKFILTKQFTGKKWRPFYRRDYAMESEETKQEVRMSTKTLADVIEALIGASYVDGGILKAMTCISTFLGERMWKHISESRDHLFNLTRVGDTLPPVLEPLEKLIGYSFQKKVLLIEAVTHASYVMDVGRRSYERLEFLGDAVLDSIIVTKLFSLEPPLPHYRMHTFKTAMVNGDFLAFVVMENGLRLGKNEVMDVDDSCGESTPSLAAWRFMRHASSAIGLEQERMQERHKAMRKEVLEAMEHGSRYPWALLARLQAKKFYSDIFEAILGAIWIDSGSKEACEAMVARFGILSFMERLLRDNVEVQHPKELLGKCAVSETVTYDIDVTEGPEGEKQHTCTILIGERVVATVDDGVSREEAQTKAALQAVELLMQEQGQLDEGDVGEPMNEMTCA
ncbi:hypothetical protein HIM_10220 [Hirsutella minnesotensis 3608]|uniref:Dicer-like protein 2 n=1 Tax=Hirsutella minnesotensis 3608 TaxID=1043627 RepID=A0A0F7ZG70_9HYPO|nr:hypothetical protein HIM_10220 [Hirsutella minnesotensis 3608]